MPVNPMLKHVMMIGSGPIVIGQAAEFDYAGTQACTALKNLGIKVTLVNPNPATIMTDAAMADKIYIEPLTIEVLKRIIRKEKPDGLLSNMGGQTGLTLSMQLAKEGFLDENGVQLLGSKLETIDKAEDRLIFKKTMEELGEPCIPSDVVTEFNAALKLADEIGYPVIVRPAFTLGGSGGGIASNVTEMTEIDRTGLSASPINQILVEKCISGWKEIEFEVIRDMDGKSIIVCSMENFDPVGVHTGDSIVAAPAMSLSDEELKMLSDSAIKIVNSLEVEGGCNVQFALHPTSMEYAIIEVNPRVSRSSALASKATGYPIAKVAAQIAVGLRLDEIGNTKDGMSGAYFNPQVKYVVVKMPKWPFDKFVYARRTLGTQMKATGEVMSIGNSFEHALMKAVRGAEIRMDNLRMDSYINMGDDELEKILGSLATDQRLFAVYAAVVRRWDIEKIYSLTMIDKWFLRCLYHICEVENKLEDQELTDDLYMEAKKIGLTDRSIEKYSGQKIKNKAHAVYKIVDTCQKQFGVETPYLYSDFVGENEGLDFIKSRKSDKKRVIVFGSGPIRIGQGVEFDYASVHCVWTLKDMGYEVIMINNNPETVSTDFDTADRLYFEPLIDEDVLDIIRQENPIGVVVAFGGQTAIKLTALMSQHGVPILGTSMEAIDTAEDREKFDAVLETLGISRPAGMGVMTKDEAFSAAHKLGYPVLVRPSYVLGGQNMNIAFSDEELSKYIDIILEPGIDSPILVDKYLMGTEVEVDAICDGTNVLIPGIMEHVERAGVHSGDSIAVYPAWNISGPLFEKLVSSTKTLALALKTKGLINIQYVIYENKVYVIEANPRASRTIPYISKVTGLSIVDIATRVMMGENLDDMGYGTGLYRRSTHYAVKVPVFSFEKLTDVDTQLGPDMKSTGEVLGVGRTFEEAMYKGLLAAGYSTSQSGGVLLSVSHRDKPEILKTARTFSRLGFKLYATDATSEKLTAAGIENTWVGSIHDNLEDIVKLMEEGKLQYLISTSHVRSQQPKLDGVRLRRRAVDHNIVVLTSIDTANALAGALEGKYSQDNIQLVDIAHLPTWTRKLNFIKMRGSGNHNIYFDCFDQSIDDPASLAVRLAGRKGSIGGDGIVLIYPSANADARMEVYNSDGTRGNISGNAIRCVAKHLYEAGRVRKERMRIETEGSVKDIKLYIRDGVVFSVSAYMGHPSFEPRDIPMNASGEAVDMDISVDGENLKITCLSVGNPHCVVFCDDVDGVDVERIGRSLENNPIFSKGTNVSFATVADRTNLMVRIWERGIGESMASGSAACAVAAAGVKLGYCPRETDITVHLPGGDLIVNCGEKGLVLTGDAKKDFEGTIEI